jgi:hypothetical protein
LSKFKLPPIRPHLLKSPLPPNSIQAFNTWAFGVLQENFALVNALDLVSGKRRIQARCENIVKVIIKFIRKGI